MAAFKDLKIGSFTTKYNLLVWCSHSCRRDVFLEELQKGNLPNYESVINRGLYMPSAVVGGHYQRTSNLSEISGRIFTSPVPFRDNILNAAKGVGAHVGVVYDSVITNGAKYLLSKGIIESVDEVYPNLIERPWFKNIAYPKIEFRPDISHNRWLYWYRERSTHRNFYNFALNFEHDGGFLEDIVNETPLFVRDQQRYSLRLQDKWFGNTLAYFKENKVLDDTVIVVFSSHGTSAESWLPLTKKITRATVDHTSYNFHPNVSHSFAFMAGPGIPHRKIDHWISIMDLKPTLCRLLDLEDLGDSIYGVDLINDRMTSSRVLADVSDEDAFSLFHPESSWLFMSIPRDADRHSVLTMGLPSAPDGRLAFYLLADPRCEEPRTEEFLHSPERVLFAAEAKRLNLSDKLI